MAECAALRLHGESVARAAARLLGFLGLGPTTLVLLAAVVREGPPHSILHCLLRHSQHDTPRGSYCFRKNQRACLVDVAVGRANLGRLALLVRVSLPACLARPALKGLCQSETPLSGLAAPPSTLVQAPAASALGGAHFHCCRRHRSRHQYLRQHQHRCCWLRGHRPGFQHRCHCRRQTLGDETTKQRLRDCLHQSWQRTQSVHHYCCRKSADSRCLCLRSLVALIAEHSRHSILYRHRRCYRCRRQKCQGEPQKRCGRAKTKIDRRRRHCGAHGRAWRLQAAASARAL